MVIEEEEDEESNANDSSDMNAVLESIDSSLITSA